MNIVFSEPKSVIWVVTNNDLKPETDEAVQKAYEQNSVAQWQFSSRMTRVDLLNGGSGVFNKFPDFIYAIDKNRDKLSPVDIIDLENLKRKLLEKKYHKEHEFLQIIDKTILQISKGFLENLLLKLPVELTRKIFASSINKKDLFKYRTYNRQFRQIFNLEYIFKVCLELKSRICLTSGFVLLKQSKMTVQQLGIHFAGVQRICFKTSHEACAKDPAKPENDCLFAQVIKTLPKIEAVELTGVWFEVCEVFSQLPDLKQFCVNNSNFYPDNYEQILRELNPRFTGGLVLSQSTPKYHKDYITIIHHGMID